MIASMKCSDVSMPCTANTKTLFDYQCSSKNMKLVYGFHKPFLGEMVPKTVFNTVTNSLLLTETALFTLLSTRLQPR